MLVSLSLTQTSVSTLSDLPSDLNIGPYLDKIVYQIIANSDQRIIAIQAGEIDMDLNFFDPVHYSTLDVDPDIEIYQTPKNGYGHLTINCDKYPLNISGLRRAFAYAFDKTRISDETFDGYNTEHDSLIPPTNPWCVEQSFAWHYYTNQSDIGNQILDNLNFTIDPGTGYRLAPDGTAFDIVIEYVSPGLVTGCPTLIGVDALHSLHINATTRGGDYNDIRSRMNLHQDYDIIFFGENFDDFDIDWLAYEYWSDCADVPYQNPTNFRNATYDSWRNQLLFGETYEEVYEAASEMQKILHYNVPLLVIYVNTYMFAYRTDQFTGYFPNQVGHVAGQWTMRKIHRTDGTPGGTVNVAADRDPDSFNFFVSDNPTSTAIFQEVWPSLYAMSPNMTAYPYLAENMLVERHEDNSDVPENHTRFTIDIIENATWTDGTSLTAEDVAFSFNYTVESAIYGNPAVQRFGDLYAAYAPNPVRVVLEFSSENYWHFSHFAYEYIIPKDIFNNETGIGYAGWNTWNPIWDPAEPYVAAGPYILVDYELGEFYELSANTDFAYYDAPPTESIPTVPPSPPPPPPPPLPPIYIIYQGIVVLVLIALVIRCLDNKEF